VGPERRTRGSPLSIVVACPRGSSVRQNKCRRRRQEEHVRQQQDVRGQTQGSAPDQRPNSRHCSQQTQGTAPTGLHMPPVSHQFLCHTSSCLTPVPVSHQFLCHTSSCVTPLPVSHHFLCHTTSCVTPLPVPHALSSSAAPRQALCTSTINLNYQVSRIKYLKYQVSCLKYQETREHHKRTGQEDTIHSRVSIH